MQKKVMAILFMLIIALPTLALAETQVETDSSGGLTDHFTHLTVPQFNGEFPLNSITISASSWIDGYLFYENTGPFGAYNLSDNWYIHELVLGGTLDPNNDDIIGGDVLVEEAYTEGQTSGQIWVEAFDGVIDYAGPSGATFAYDDLQSWTIVITPDNPLYVAFIGNETVEFSAQARVWQGVSISGADNDWGLHTEAGYDITVTYDFDGTVATEAATFDGIKAMYR